MPSAMIGPRMGKPYVRVLSAVVYLYSHTVTAVPTFSQRAVTQIHKIFIALSVLLRKI